MSFRTLLAHANSFLGPSTKSMLLQKRQSVGLWYGRRWRLRSKFLCRSHQKIACAFLRKHAGEMFFVFGSGRSGTQLITTLLQRSGNAHVFHEPNFNEDVGTMAELRSNPDLALEYWRFFRSFKIYRRWFDEDPDKLYGEVNGTIRYQAGAIRQLYPEANLFLLSRDGRGFVRSVMGWTQFYSESSTGAFALAPLPGDPYHVRWKNMTRFEKICWSWMEANEFLMGIIPENRYIQLEKISQDYNYCKSRFLNPLNINLTAEDWQSCVSERSANASDSYGFPTWDEWSDDQKSIFQEICKDTMDRLGYKIT